MMKLLIILFLCSCLYSCITEREYNNYIEMNYLKYKYSNNLK